MVPKLPTVRDSLPQLHAVSGPLEGRAMWNATLDLRHPEIQSIVGESIINAQHAAQQISPDAADALSWKLLRELESIERTVENEELLVVQFLRFWLSVHPLCHAIGVGMLPRAHDWIDRSIGFPDREDQIEPLRPFLFSSLVSSFVRLNWAHSLIEWLQGLYYYAWKAGSQTEIATEVFPFARGYITKRWPNTESVMAGLHLLTWAMCHRATDAVLLARDIEHLVDVPGVSSDAKRQIRILFSTSVGSLTSVPIADRAAQVLKLHGHELAAHERLQMLVSIVAGNATRALEELPRIEAAIKEWNQHLRDVQRDNGVASLYSHRNTHAVVMPLIGLFVENGHCAVATSLLADFLDVPIGERRRIPPMILMPTHRSGALYSVEGHVLTGSHDPDGLGRLCAAANAFLGATVMYTSDPTFELRSPKQVGIVDRSAADKLEAEMRSHYITPGLNEFIAEHGASIDGLLVIPGQQHPLPALLLEQLGKVWPLVVCNRQRLPDRSVRAVMLWASGTYTAQFETDDVAEILTRQGIEVTVVREAETSAARFRSEYCSARWDVLWMVGHGEYDHYEPHRSHLWVSPSEKLTISELRELGVPAVDEGRRLLVLNTCDSGISASHDGPSEIGLASAVTSAQQAVVAHAWPVDPLVAAIFGGLLARGLVDAGTFFPAYRDALQHLLMGKATVLARLGPGQLHDRLELRSGIFNNLADRGSALFLE